MNYRGGGSGWHEQRGRFPQPEGGFPPYNGFQHNSRPPIFNNPSVQVGPPMQMGPPPMQMGRLHMQMRLPGPGWIDQRFGPPPPQDPVFYNGPSVDNYAPRPRPVGSRNGPLLEHGPWRPPLIQYPELKHQNRDPPANFLRNMTPKENTAPVSDTTPNIDDAIPIPQKPLASTKAPPMQSFSSVFSSIRKLVFSGEHDGEGPIPSEKSSNDVKCSTESAESDPKPNDKTPEEMEKLMHDEEPEKPIPVKEPESVALRTSPKLGFMISRRPSLLTDDDESHIEVDKSEVLPPVATQPDIPPDMSTEESCKKPENISKGTEPLLNDDSVYQLQMQAMRDLGMLSVDSDQKGKTDEEVTKVTTEAVPTTNSDKSDNQTVEPKKLASFFNSTAARSAFNKHNDHDKPLETPVIPETGDGWPIKPPWLVATTSNLTEKANHDLDTSTVMFPGIPISELEPPPNKPEESGSDESLVENRYKPRKRLTLILDNVPPRLPVTPTSITDAAFALPPGHIQESLPTGIVAFEPDESMYPNEYQETVVPYPRLKPLLDLPVYDKRPPSQNNRSDFSPEPKPSNSTEVSEPPVYDGTDRNWEPVPKSHSPEPPDETLEPLSSNYMPYVANPHPSFTAPAAVVFSNIAMGRQVPLPLQNYYSSHPPPQMPQMPFAQFGPNCSMMLSNQQSDLQYNTNDGPWNNNMQLATQSESFDDEPLASAILPPEIVNLVIEDDAPEFDDLLKKFREENQIWYQSITGSGPPPNYVEHEPQQDPDEMLSEPNNPQATSANSAAMQSVPQHNSFVPPYNGFVPPPTEMPGYPTTAFQQLRFPTDAFPRPGCPPSLNNSQPPFRDQNAPPRLPMPTKEYAEGFTDDSPQVKEYPRRSGFDVVSRDAFGRPQMGTNHMQSGNQPSPEKHNEGVMTKPNFSSFSQNVCPNDVTVSNSMSNEEPVNRRNRSISNNESAGGLTCEQQMVDNRTRSAISDSDMAPEANNNAVSGLEQLQQSYTDENDSRRNATWYNGPECGHPPNPHAPSCAVVNPDPPNTLNQGYQEPTPANGTTTNVEFMGAVEASRPGPRTLLDRIGRYHHPDRRSSYCPRGYNGPGPQYEMLYTGPIAPQCGQNLHPTQPTSYNFASFSSAALPQPQPQPPLPSHDNMDIEHSTVGAGQHQMQHAHYVNPSNPPVATAGVYDQQGQYQPVQQQQPHTQPQQPHNFQQQASGYAYGYGTQAQSQWATSFNPQVSMEYQQQSVPVVPCVPVPDMASYPSAPAPGYQMMSHPSYPNAQVPMYPPLPPEPAPSLFPAYCPNQAPPPPTFAMVQSQPSSQGYSNDDVAAASTGSDGSMMRVATNMEMQIVETVKKKANALKKSKKKDIIININQHPVVELDAPVAKTVIPPSESNVNKFKFTFNASTSKANPENETTLSTASETDHSIPDKSTTSNAVPVVPAVPVSEQSTVENKFPIALTTPTTVAAVTMATPVVVSAPTTTMNIMSQNGEPPPPGTTKEVSQIFTEEDAVEYAEIENRRKKLADIARSLEEEKEREAAESRAEKALRKSRLPQRNSSRSPVGLREVCGRHLFQFRRSRSPNRRPRSPIRRSRSPLHKSHKSRSKKSRSRSRSGSRRKKKERRSGLIKKSPSPIKSSREEAWNRQRSANLLAQAIARKRSSHDREQPRAEPKHESSKKSKKKRKHKHRKSHGGSGSESPTSVVRKAVKNGRKNAERNPTVQLQYNYSPEENNTASDSDGDRDRLRIIDETETVDESTPTVETPPKIQDANGNLNAYKPRPPSVPNEYMQERPIPMESRPEQRKRGPTTPPPEEETTVPFQEPRPSLYSQRFQLKKPMDLRVKRDDKIGTPSPSQTKTVARHASNLVMTSNISPISNHLTSFSVALENTVMNTETISTTDYVRTTQVVQRVQTPPPTTAMNAITFQPLSAVAKRVLTNIGDSESVTSNECQEEGAPSSVDISPQPAPVVRIDAPLKSDSTESRDPRLFRRGEANQYLRKFSDTSENIISSDTREVKKEKTTKKESSGSVIRNRKIESFLHDVEANTTIVEEPPAIYDKKPKKGKRHITNPELIEEVQCIVIRRLRHFTESDVITHDQLQTVYDRAWPKIIQNTSHVNEGKIYRFVDAYVSNFVKKTSSHL